MINKRADTTVEPLVVLSIAIAVLAIVGLGFYIHYAGEIAFFKYLPDFSLNKTKVSSSTILRYDLTTQKTEYYDGNKGVSVPKNIGDYELSEGSLNNDFYNYYFLISTRPKRESVLLQTHELYVDYGTPEEYFYSQKGIYFTKNLPQLGFQINTLSSTIPQDEKQPLWYQVPFDKLNKFLASILTTSPIFLSSGDTSVQLINYRYLGDGDNSGYGEVILAADNSLWFLPISDIKKHDLDYANFKKIESISGYYKVIYDYTLNWRDSVLNKPITFNFDKDKGFCTERVKFGNHVYLVVDLSKPVIVGSVC